MFATFAVYFLIGWRGGVKATLLMVAIVSSAFWAASVAAAMVWPVPALWWVARLIDAIRIGAWLGFLLQLVTGWQHRRSALSDLGLKPRMLALLIFVLVVGAFLPQDPPWTTAATNGPIGAFYALLGSSVFGLALTELLYYRTPVGRRWAIKPLVIGLAGMFALDLIIYSSAVLFRQVDPSIWAARGIAHSFAIAFVAVATARNASWTIDVHVSRDLVFRSTAVFAAGIYLLLVAAAGYWVHYFGGDWGGTLRVAFIFAAILTLVTLVLSGSTRAKLKVFISKNLYSYRYEYRKEWLKFTRKLGTHEPGENLYQQVVRALADLVESNGGSIWLEHGNSYSQFAAVDAAENREVEAASSSLVRFLSRTGWVVQLDEFAASPERYQELSIPEWLSKQKDAWLVIPLPVGNELLGFVVLLRPRTSIDINWEVRDLLKTASRQASTFLAQFRAKEALMESEKFSAFNRMSAFVVHDLKNLVAQLMLLLKNAERHRDNPEFQRDMLETVEHVATRMNQLMQQLRTGTSPMEKPHPVDIYEVIKRIAHAKGIYDASIDSECMDTLRALAHEDRIERVIGHIVQNAIEATPAGAQHVKIRASSDDKYAIVEIFDQGVGMSPEFVKEKLFHPFQTTKPHGMGIGMYESFQYLSTIGGRITVESMPGCGTRFQVYLLLASENAAAALGMEHSL